MLAASTCAQINQLQVLIQRGEIREICFVRWRRPVLVVVDKAGVVVVLHEAPAKPIGPVDETLGAQRRRRRVVH